MAAMSSNYLGNPIATQESILQISQSVLSISMKYEAGFLDFL
jgi:hypothetical protein